MPIFLDPVAPEHRRRMRLRRQRRLLVGVIWVGVLVVVAGAVHPAVAEVVSAVAAVATAFALAIVLIAASGGVRRRQPKRR